MSYKELAREIKAGYNDLKKDTTYKLYNVTWNNELETSELTDVEIADVEIAQNQSCIKSANMVLS